MGQDDRDEGGDGCPEHVWNIVGASIGPDGSQIDYGCDRCGAVMVETEDDLTGQTH